MEREDFGDGATVSVIEYDHRLEGTLSVTLLASTKRSELEESVKTWLAEKATSEDFGFPAGGTVIITDAPVSRSNEEAATASITCVYYPKVPNQTATA